jgi:hypothetical protein
MSLSVAARRARLLAVRDAIDAAGGGAVHLYGGTQAGAPEEPASTAPLAIIALAVPSMSLHATLAQMVLPATVGYAALSGVPTWARFVNGDGLPVLDCSAGLPGSGAVLTVTDGKVPAGSTLYVGGEITVSMTFVEPA